MSDYLSDPHRLVLKALGGALTLGDDLEAWSCVSRVLFEALSPDERARLLYTALNTTDPQDAVEIVEAYLSVLIEGRPLPVIDEIEDSARWWADCASFLERRAWLAACFVRLPVREQAAFLREATRRAAA